VRRELFRAKGRRCGVRDEVPGQDGRLCEEVLDGGEFRESSLAVIVEVVHGTYDVKVLVAREGEDCDVQVGWGYGVRESGPLSSSSKLFNHLILAFRCLRNPDRSSCWKGQESIDIHSRQ